jgi:phosphate transport system permease protein
MVGFFIQLFRQAIPAMGKFGFSFLISTNWDPVKLDFGAAPAIFGTLLTSAIALGTAVPLSFILAMFLVETAPQWLSRIMETAIDMLAAIPSIIYGMWGLFVLVPIMETLRNFVCKTMGLEKFSIFSGNGGFSYLTAGLVLSLMILPFICAVMRDVLRMTPPVLKESAYGIGATTSEVTFHITMRYGMQGMTGAVFLGLGRAVGETMAVLFVIGNVPKVTASLFAPGTTIASQLANDFGEAEGIFQSTLFELGLILLSMSFLIQVAGQLWLNRVRASSGRGL